MVPSTGDQPWRGTTEWFCPGLGHGLGHGPGHGPGHGHGPKLIGWLCQRFFFFVFKLGLRGQKETQNGPKITFFYQFCPRAPMFVLGTQNQKDAGRKTMQNPASRIPNGAIWCKLWPKNILGKPGSILGPFFRANGAKVP